MIRKLSLHILILLVFAVASVILLGGASSALAADEPLVIIRLNNDMVEYEEPLDRAIKMARHIKPDVFFDIVSIAPETTNKNSNKKLSEEVRFHAEKITNQLQQRGVADEMIRTSFQQNKFIKSNEIQIFVQ